MISSLPAPQALASELAVLNNAKVQVQREFEAFKEMATQVGGSAVSHWTAASASHSNAPRAMQDLLLLSSPHMGYGFHSPRDMIRAAFHKSLPHGLHLARTCLQASRANREEVARLLEENANLRTRLAARAMEGVAGGKDYGGARV